jgi:acetolactate synthase-1/2/3 large subunit
LVLDALVAEGVDVVFGYPGGAIMPLYDELFGHRVRHVLVRHEAAAVFAAGGYARSSGRVGVCMATSGPGATNLVTGLLDAMMDNVPVVAITGQVRTALLGTDGFQEADVASITQAITKRNVVIRDVADVVPAIRAAFRMARGPRPGPVLVDLPTDILKALHEEPAQKPAPAPAPVAAAETPEGPDPAAVVQTVDLLCSAEKPVIIVGGGARWSGARDEYREFLSLCGAPHTATVHGLGSAADGDPNFLGMAGMHGWKRANVAISQSDALIALGMRFDDRITGNPKRFATKATVVHADIDRSEFDKIVPAKIKLHADLKATLHALNAELRKRPTVERHQAWAAHAVSVGSPPPRDRAAESALSATDVLDALFAAITPGTIVTTDVGQHQMWAAQRARPNDPREFMTSGGLGSMGFGFPAAIGAQFANPDRSVVVVCGDGGFQMSLAELATLKRYGVPVKIALIDNRNLGMVRQWQQLFYSERYSATSLQDNPDFAALAAAYGIDAIKVSAHSDLPGAMRRFLDAKGPILMHCACFPMENVWPMIPSGTSVDESIEAVPA